MEQFCLFLEQMLAQLKVLRDGNRVTPIKASAAKSPCLASNRFKETFNAQIAQTVSANVSANLFNIELSGDEFASGCSVNAVEARESVGRGTDADMNFLCSRLTQHADDVPSRRASDDAIFNHDDTLAFNDLPERRQFDADT
jgi:hypothetical protein